MDFLLWWQCITGDTTDMCDVLWADFLKALYFLYHSKIMLLGLRDKGFFLGGATRVTSVRSR